MPRQNFPKRVKVAAFERAKGHCEECTAYLVPGKFHFDHDNMDALGGKPTLENCKVLCIACHSEKTAKQDAPRLAKANRQRDKYLGIQTRRKQKIPGSKGTRFKKKLDGTVVLREPTQ